MGVSVITTVMSLITLAVGTLVFGMAAWAANILATALATGPSYHLNRRWTWGRRDASDPWREILPFWVLSFSGLVLSTIAVGVADAWGSSLGLAPGLHTVMLLMAHMAGFGALWGVQFVFLDRVLFGRETAGIHLQGRALQRRAAQPALSRTSTTLASSAAHLSPARS
jgi:putative flippase GtrA